MLPMILYYLFLLVQTQEINGWPSDGQAFPGSSEVKASAAMQEIWVRSLGWEDSPGEGNGNPLQYSCLENPTDGGDWWATIHGVAKSQTRLSDFTSLDGQKEYYYYFLPLRSLYNFA